MPPTNEDHATNVRQGRGVVACSSNTPQPSPIAEMNGCRKLWSGEGALNDRLWVEAGAVDQACSQAIVAQRCRVVLAVAMMH